MQNACSTTTVRYRLTNIMSRLTIEQVYEKGFRENCFVSRCMTRHRAQIVYGITGFSILPANQIRIALLNPYIGTFHYFRAVRCGVCMESVAKENCWLFNWAVQWNYQIVENLIFGIFLCILGRPRVKFCSTQQALRHHSGSHIYVAGLQGIGCIESEFDVARLLKNLQLKGSQRLWEGRKEKLSFEWMGQENHRASYWYQ